MDVRIQTMTFSEEVIAANHYTSRSFATEKKKEKGSYLVMFLPKFMAWWRCICRHGFGEKRKDVDFMLICYFGY